MSIAEAIIKDVQTLSESKQVEVLDFVQWLLVEFNGLK